MIIRYSCLAVNQLVAGSNPAAGATPKDTETVTGFGFFCFNKSSLLCAHKGFPHSGRENKCDRDKHFV